MDTKTFIDTILVGLTPDQKITVACRVLHKDVGQYDHLDNGRKSMTALNLLRNALAKDDALMPVLEDAVFHVFVGKENPSPLAQPLLDDKPKKTPAEPAWRPLPNRKIASTGQTIINTAPGHWVAIN